MNDKENVGGMIKTFDEPEKHEGMRQFDLVPEDLDEFEGKKVYKTKFHNRTQYDIQVPFGEEVKKFIVPARSIRILRSIDPKKLYSRYSDVYYKSSGNSYYTDVKVRRGWDDSKVWDWPFVEFHNISGEEDVVSYLFDSGFQSVQMIKGIPVVRTIDPLNELAEYRKFEIVYVDKLEKDETNRGYLKRVARTEHRKVDRRPKAELDKLRKLREQIALDEGKARLGLRDKI
ncbi:MAG: hypothetical protein ACFFDI_01015 [Promethearchaeota archaeon]